MMIKVARKVIGREADHDQGGAEFGDKQKQHQNDKNTAFQQGVHHRFDAGLNQGRAVIEHIDAGFFRQAVLYFGNQPP